MSIRFTTPVYRHGDVLQPDDCPQLSFNQANAVGDYFLDELETASGASSRHSALEHYLGQFTEFCQQHSIKATPHEEIRHFRLDHMLTPIVRLPAFYLNFAGFNFVSRETVTVCTGASKSKLWISLSLRDHPDNLVEMDLDAIKKLRDQFIAYTDLRKGALIRYYTNVINFLIDSQVSEFKDYNNGEHIRLKKYITFNIISIETPIDIRDTLITGLKLGRQHMQQSLEQDNPDKRSVFKKFLEFVPSCAGESNIDNYSFFIQNSTPMYEGENEIRPLIRPGRFSLQRLALVLSVRNQSAKPCPIEWYCSLGSCDMEFTKRRYRNSDISSRAIMAEVGRVY